MSTQHTYRKGVILCKVAHKYCIDIFVYHWCSSFLLFYSLLSIIFKYIINGQQGCLQMYIIMECIAISDVCLINTGYTAINEAIGAVKLKEVIYNGWMRAFQMIQNHQW